MRYMRQERFQRYWDDSAKGRTSWNGNHFTTYDDPESLGTSILVMANGLGASCSGELSQDYSSENAGGAAFTAK